MELVNGLILQPGVADHPLEAHKIWQRSRKSAYNAFFLGRVRSVPWKRIWKTWAPLRCKIFIWLAVKNRCWTADRLAKRGLPHPAVCPL